MIPQQPDKPGNPRQRQGLLKIDMSDPQPKPTTAATRRVLTDFDNKRKYAREVVCKMRTVFRNMDMRQEAKNPALINKWLAKYQVAPEMFPLCNRIMRETINKDL